MLLKVISSIRYLARQGLALRGSGNEEDGNFLQMLRAKADEDPRVNDWLKKKINKYTSHDIQNKLLKDMAINVLRSIASELQLSPFITVMMDETTDAANKEQVTIVFRLVTNDFEVHEEFLGLYEVSSIDASTLVKVMKDCLCRMNIPISRIRGQCYDGASTMRGAKSGVAKIIKDEEPRALYTHCYGHSINLAVNDAIKQLRPIKGALETAYEITKLIKYSPRREGIFEQLKCAHEVETGFHSAGIRLLCPTRWTVRANTLESIIVNYEVLLDTWDEALDVCRDTEIKARINGVWSQMKTFDFVFGTILGELILRHSDNLSRTIQSKNISAAEGQQLAKLVIATLRSIREEDKYDLFWTKLLKFAEDNDVDDPQLPRRKRRPARLQDGDAGHYHACPKDYYRQLYYEALDSSISCLAERLDQPDYKKYCQLEQLLIKACLQQEFEDEFQFLNEFYKEDFNSSALQAQLITLGVQFQGNFKGNKDLTIFDVKDHFISMSSAKRNFYDQVVKLVQLVLVMPATNATSERSFSALRRVKNYLRANMLQERLNNLMILHVHKERTDSLDLKVVANEFISSCEHRVRLFGTFKIMS